jgi:hypothetical protein
MKITKSQLKQIIQEELSAILGEEEVNELAASPFNPDPGSPAACNVINDKIDKIYAMWYDNLRDFRDERSIAYVEMEMGSEIENLKGILKTNGCPEYKTKD